MVWANSASAAGSASEKNPSTISPSVPRSTVAFSPSTSRRFGARRPSNSAVTENRRKPRAALRVSCRRFPGSSRCSLGYQTHGPNRPTPMPYPGSSLRSQNFRDLPRARHKLSQNRAEAAPVLNRHHKIAKASTATPNNPATNSIAIIRRRLITSLNFPVERTLSYRLSPIFITL